MEPKSSELRNALLDSLTGCIAVLTAAECGLLKQLAASEVDLAGLQMPHAGGHVLLELLAQNGIVEMAQDTPIRLTPSFAMLWAEEGEALLSRAAFSLMAARDMIDNRQAYFGSRPAFMAQAQTYGFFCYNRARDTKVGNLQDCAPWVDYVSALNGAEANALVAMVPMEDRTRLLEIGGNTGGFALALLAKHPQAQAVVFDLPAVCEIGRKRRSSAADANRLRFVAGDARTDVLPEVAGQAPDLILFKSVLHDWDEVSARDLLARAVDRLAPSGKLVVLERGKFTHRDTHAQFSSATNLVFAAFYRDPAWYADTFRELGLAVVTSGPTRLDMAFFATCGRMVT